VYNKAESLVKQIKITVNGLVESVMTESLQSVSNILNDRYVPNCMYYSYQIDRKGSCNFDYIHSFVVDIEVESIDGLLEVFAGSCNVVGIFKHTAYLKYS
jgi:hypothetical protein